MARIERALISVSDKTGVVELARALASHGVEIVSTGGTAALLKEAGVDVVEVARYTGFPEILDGRVKTLHPRVHAGLLARRDSPAHRAALQAHDIPPIDLLAVNLYPFERTIARAGCTFDEAIEHIDVGGPAMLRAAAKNFDAVTVLVEHEDYAAVLDEIARTGEVSRATRERLAVKAFAHTARYDGAIANYLGARAQADALPPYYSMQFRKRQSLRYGENPHQKAAFYLEPSHPEPCMATARQLQGKELSFNNIADADSALECVKSFDEPACVIVKHANPCGVALGRDNLEAYDRAYATDPTSAFGGIIAFNCPLDAATAKAVVERQFVEVIVAPSVAPEARAALAAKPNVRVLECGAWTQARARDVDLKRVVGGLLVQERDTAMVTAPELKVVTRRAPTEAELRDLLFVWKVAKFVKSNAIVYGKDGRTLGIGAGQMSRVYSARIAAIKAADAGLEVRGSVLASDAFFPFRDGLDQAAEVGVTAVVQPGGSMRDQEVIDAADQHGIAMVFTGVRHFRH